MANDRPNILMIMTDQQRGDCLGCDGNDAIETPYLDDLASRGTRFRHAYSAVPSCLPARASLLTGMDQWHTGMLGMGGGYGPIRNNYAHTLPGELAKAGYHTQSVGKNHFHPQRTLNGYHHCLLDESGRVVDREFLSDYREWFEQNKTGPYGYRDHSVDWNSWMSRPSHLPEHLHPTWWTAEQSIGFLKRRDPEKPFFLKMSFARPHSPYDPPQSYYDLYHDVDMPEPHIGDWSSMHDVPLDAADTDAWHGKIADRMIRRARRCYYASVTFIDHQISRVLYELKRHQPDVLANTMIVFFSDHGDMLGDHHLWRKTYAYEGSARVPMIITPPSSWSATGGTVGQVRDEVTELRDVMPTLLDAAGVDIPDTCQGQSMLPLARGETVLWREYLHGEHARSYGYEQAMQYITDGRMKYIYFPYLGTEQLFDMETDPGECHDLSGEAERIAPWRQRLINELEQRGCGTVQNGQLRTLDRSEIIPAPLYDQFNRCVD